MEDMIAPVKREGFGYYFVRNWRKECVFEVKFEKYFWKIKLMMICEWKLIISIEILQSLNI